jgi:hypothetical protein
MPTARLRIVVEFIVRSPEEHGTSQVGNPLREP